MSRGFFLKYSDWDATTNRGAYWIAKLQEYFDIKGIIALASQIAVIFLAMKLSVPTWAIFLSVILLHIIILIARYIIGKIDRKVGLWKTQNEFNAKMEHLAPWNIEVQETLKEICKKLEIENKFKDI